MSKRRKIQHEAFECTSTKGRFTKITHSMMKSKAWKELTLAQQGLYLYLKSKYTRYESGDNNANDISLPHSEYMTLYSNQRTFWKDMDALINHGFIKVHIHGYTTRKPNIYAFSAMWRKYGTDDFHISKSDRRYKRAN